MNNLSDIIELDVIGSDRVEKSREMAIIHHMIMFDDIISFVYTKHLEGQIRRQYFNEYDGILYKWLIDYFSSYGEAPKRNIQTIFDSRKSELSSERQFLIEKRLDTFAVDFYSTPREEIHLEAIKKELIPGFVFEKKLELLKGKIKDLNSYDKHEYISETIETFKDFNFEETSDNFGVVIPGSQEEVDKYFATDNYKGLFSLPGAIGKVIGPFARGATYAVTGTEKSGKTIFMQEILYQAVIFHGLKVLLISLEMSSEDLNERIWCRIGNFTNDRLSVGYNLLPTMDCLNNQLGECQVLRELLNKKRLLRSTEDLVAYADRREWITCTKCRNIKYEFNSKKKPRGQRFIPAIWYKEKKIGFINKIKTERAIRKLNMFGFKNYRIRAFPRFSANFEEVKNVYRGYCKKTGFKPDLVVLDYPDILQPIDGKLLDRQNIDFNWKSCARFAQEEDLSLIIADQTNKAARQQRSIKAADTSEDKRKDAHINMRITINSNDQERALGLQRIGTLFKRKGKTTTMEVMLFQNLACYNPLLDSCFWPHVSWLKYPTVKESEKY